MQCTPHELKDKLLKALDKDNNVVDMPAVLVVISALEKYPVTRDTLEQTRLGKHVNELRKKTNNKDLAKRAKNLVRKWQKLLVTGTPSSHSAGPRVNGEGITGKLADGSTVPASAIPPHLTHLSSGSKPNSPVSRPGTPSSGKSNLSPSLPSWSAGNTPPSRPATPIIAASQQSRLSPKASVIRPATPALKPASPAFRGHTPGSRLSPHLAKTPTACGRPSNPAGESFSKTNVANKRKRREEDSPEDTPIRSKMKATRDTSFHDNSPCTPTSKHKPDVLNGVYSRLQNARNGTSKFDVTGNSSQTSQVDFNTPSIASCRTPSTTKVITDSTHEPNTVTPRNANLMAKTTDVEKTPSSGSSQKVNERTPRIKRVKSTAELIQDLYASGSLKITSSETVAKIARNQIEKEPDDRSASIVPAGAKPRQRRKPVSTIQPPSTSQKMLKESKNELMQKFLNCQAVISPSPETSSGLAPSSSSADLFLSKLEPPIDVESLDNVNASPVPNKAGLTSKQVSDLSKIAGDKRNSDYPSGTVDGALTNISCKIDPTVLDDPWSQIPPLNLDDIDWSTDTYTVPDVNPVTDEDVERLHSEHWPGVAGQFDHQNSWHEWTHTYSMPTLNGELLHILPYVNIDD